MPKLKNKPIRIETGYTRGWQVRFYYEKNGSTKYHSRLFSDGVHGSEEEAHDAAIAYRDRHHEEYAGDYRNHEIEPYRRRDKRNNSGVPGIVFYKYDGVKRPRIHVRAHICQEDGKVRTKSISLNKHGNELAVVRACKFRFDGLKKLHGDANPATSWQRLYNEIVETVGDRYDLRPAQEPENNSTAS